MNRGDAQFLDYLQLDAQAGIDAGKYANGPLFHGVLLQSWLMVDG
jgi:hypothetical protein